MITTVIEVIVYVTVEHEDGISADKIRGNIVISAEMTEAFIEQSGVTEFEITESEIINAEIIETTEDEDD